MNAAPADRRMSLDAFRGLAIAAMILVNDPGSWDQVYPQLLHAEWIGWTFTDFIFPAFMYVIGVSMWFSFSSRIDNGRVQVWRRSLVRALLIFLTGLFISWFPFYHLTAENLYFAGVLQRIAVSYAIAATVCVALRWYWIPVVAALLLLFHWLLSAWIAGWGEFDRQVFFGHGVDTISLLSTPASAVPILCGYLSGNWIARCSFDARALAVMLGIGLAMIVAGFGWSFQLPIIKSVLWTSSYVLFTTGAAIVAFGISLYVIDVRRWRRWATPLIHFGLNPLLIYVISIILDKLTWMIKIGDPPVPLHTWTYESLFLPVAGAVNGSLLYAIVFVVLHWAIAFSLARRRIIFKL